jgi:hypothetical protein
MRNDRKIKGAIYNPYRQIEQTRADWQRLMSDAIAAGGRRRAEGGETFIHGAGGHLIGEIWEIVPEPGIKAAKESFDRALAQLNDDAMAGEELPA